jgi:hypothetical protein
MNIFAAAGANFSALLASLQEHAIEMAAIVRQAIAFHPPCQRAYRNGQCGRNRRHQWRGNDYWYHRRRGAFHCDGHDLVRCPDRPAHRYQRRKLHSDPDCGILHRGFAHRR